MRGKQESNKIAKERQEKEEEKRRKKEEEEKILLRFGWLAGIFRCCALRVVGSPWNADRGTCNL